MGYLILSQAHLGYPTAPQHLSLNSINYCSSSPLTSSLSANSSQAYSWGARECWGCRSKLLEALVRNFASSQPNLSVAMPAGTKAHRPRRTDPKSSVCETLWGRRPPTWPDAPGPASPCPALQPPAARRQEAGSRAVMLCEAGLVTQPLCARV